MLSILLQKTALSSPPLIKKLKKIKLKQLKQKPQPTLKLLAQLLLLTLPLKPLPQLLLLMLLIFLPASAKSPFIINIVELLELLEKKYVLHPAEPPRYIKKNALSLEVAVIEKDSLSQATKTNAPITTHSFEPLPCEEQTITTNHPSLELISAFTYCEVEEKETIYHIKPKVLYTDNRNQIKILTQKEANELYQKLLNAPRTTKILYPLIPNPEFLTLCQNIDAECLPVKDFFVVKADKETIKQLQNYALEKKPIYRIKAIIVLLSQSAKKELSLNLNLNLSQTPVPKFQELKAEPPNLTLKYQSGILNLLEVQIRALQENNQASILSTPELILTAWEEGLILTGQEIPYITPATANIPATVSFKQAFLSLKVKIEPTIEGKARIKIALTKDTPNYSINTDNPPIDTTRLEMVLNQTLPTVVYLGGIKEQAQTHTRKKNLFIFPTKEDNTQERELYIFLSIEEEKD